MQHNVVEQPHIAQNVILNLVNRFEGVCAGILCVAHRHLVSTVAWRSALRTWAPDLGLGFRVYHKGFQVLSSYKWETQTKTMIADTETLLFTMI